MVISKNGATFQWWRTWDNLEHPACVLFCPPQISLEVTQGWTWGPMMNQPASNPWIIQWPLCNSVILSKMAFSFHVLISDHLCKVICTHQASLCQLLYTLVVCYKPQNEMCLFMWFYCFIFCPARTIADTDIHFKFVNNLWGVLSAFETCKVKMPFLSVIPTNLCIQQNAKLEVLVVVKMKVKIFLDVVLCMMVLYLFPKIPYTGMYPMDVGIVNKFAH